MKHSISIRYNHIQNSSWDVIRVRVKPFLLKAEATPNKSRQEINVNQTRKQPVTPPAVPATPAGIPGNR